MRLEDEDALDKSGRCYLWRRMRFVRGGENVVKNLNCGMVGATEPLAGQYMGGLWETMGKVEGRLEMGWNWCTLEVKL